MNPEIKAGTAPEVDRSAVHAEKIGANHEPTIESRNQSVYAEKADLYDYKADAIAAEDAEHNMTVMQAVKAYPKASFWAFVMACTIIMESYDVFLIGNFVALPAFKREFGVFDPSLPIGNQYVIQAKWQSALQVSGQLGALIGVFIAGPLTSRVGYRWATMTGLIFLNAFIFIFYFANSLPVIFVAQLLEGLPWGIFIANSPAYCSEIVPIKLRAPCTQMIQMFWAIGSIIVGGVTYHYEHLDGAEAYRVPIALQWLFPTPLLILMFFAPESPWWLVRHGKLEQAAKSIRRLGSKGSTNVNETVAMMRRVVEMEKDEKSPGYIELFKKTDLRRTLIVAGVYAAQNLTGNLIANQAVYFFQQAGIADTEAFALGLITSALQWVMVMLSWILTSYFGRRPIYLWGSAVNTTLLIALGIAASIPVHTAAAKNNASLAQAALGLIVSVLFCLGAAPVSYAVIGETSSLRLRPLTTGFGRAVYYIVEIPCIFLASYMLNPQQGDLGGKCGYVWGATGLMCLIVAYFQLPEFKGRSYRELDILFKRRVSARKFHKTDVDVNDDE